MQTFLGGFAEKPPKQNVFFFLKQIKYQKGKINFTLNYNLRKWRILYALAKGYSNKIYEDPIS